MQLARRRAGVHTPATPVLIPHALLVLLVFWPLPQQPQNQPNQPGTRAAPLVVQVDSANRREEAEHREREGNERAAGENALVKYTLYLAIIAFLQLLVFGFQAHQLRATVQQMRETSHVELRAYVHVTSIGVNNGRFHAKITNVGRTPAHNLTFVVSLYHGPQTNEEKPVEGPGGSRSVLPPGSHVNLTTIPPALTDEDKARIALGEPRIISAQGRIDYADVFGKPRYTVFRFTSEGEFLREGNFVATAEGNNAT